MIINAKDKGILLNTDISKGINSLFQELREIKEEKILVLEKGDYFINSENCPEEMLYITNTIGDAEFKKGENPPPHLQKIALHISGINDLTIQGNGARFVISGKLTNAAIQNCENIEINDIKIKVNKPDFHELRAIHKTAFYADFEIDKNTDYEVKGSSLYFKGKDYYYNPLKKYRAAWHLARIDENTPNSVCRVPRPFLTAIRTKEIKKGVVRIYFASTAQIVVGSRYYLFDNRRQYVGIFVDSSKNIALKGITQHFNYSLAYVAQNSENLEIANCTFAPEEETGLKMCSCADFVQICMCKGKAYIHDNDFSGAADDCLNAHGMHLKIKSINGSKMVVRYMHPQSHGYNAFHIGDELAFIKPLTLAESGRTKITSSKLLNEYDIELGVESTENAKIGNVVENITMCPDVCFENNTANLIITRGLLLTTRGRVIVKNNHFTSTTMSGILLSNDANSWYESGPCKDVTIQGNVFDYCGDTPILIKPENLSHTAYIHENIKILDNEFRAYNGPCVKAKSSKNILIKGNKYANDNHISQTNCENVDCE